MAIYCNTIQRSNQTKGARYEKYWGILVSVHPLCFATGSIVKKPGVIKDRIEIRGYLYITALIDHDIIDDAPAVRALSKLTKLVESGYGLS